MYRQGNNPLKALTKEILMKKHAIILTIGILVSKVFGLVRETVLSSFYGVSMYADIYKVSNELPNVIFGLVAAGIVTTFIPIYSKIREKQSEKEANKYLSNILNIMLIISTILCIFGFIFAEEILGIYARGFKGQKLEIAVTFLRISIFSIIMLSTKGILEGYLQIKQKFLSTVMSGILMNIVIVTSIVLSGVFRKPVIMAWGILVSVLLQTLLMVVISIRTGYRHQKTLDPTNTNVIDMLKMAGPIILGTSIDQINKAIDTTIASTLQDGAIAILGYAVRVSDSILGIFVTSISNVMYPSLARQASQGKVEDLKITVRKIMNTINLMIIPATFGLIILSQPVVNLLYRKLSTTDPAAAKITALAMACYTVGTIGYGLRQILVRTFYSLHDSKTPVISSIIAVMINILLNLVFAKWFGVPGLALATSFSALASVVILYTALRRKIGSLGTKDFLITTSKIFIASIAMGIVVFGVYRFMGGTLGMIVSIAAGVIVYAVMIFLMKIPEADDLFNLVLKKIKR